MNWWEDQIQKGWKGPAGRPRGSTDASFPLVPNQRYFVSFNPLKSHLLLPGTDYAYCGLTLAADELWLIDSGYDAWYWVVYDDHLDGKKWCGPCGDWKQRLGKWKPELPKDSPIEADEWAVTYGAEVREQGAALDRMANVVALWLDGEVVDR